MVKSIKGKWAVCCTEVVHFLDGPLLEVLLYDICDKTGIIATLSYHNPEVKHIHTFMSESAH